MGDDPGFDEFSADDVETGGHDGLLDEQRANARSCQAPGLYRLNGCGTSMFGRSNAADDGTYVKTLAFSLFWIPVFPIAQYLVSDGEDKGWYFHAKVPLSDSAKRNRNGVLAVAALAVLMIAILFWREGSRSDVHVVNGLDVALEVVLGEEHLNVSPGELVAREVPAGPLHVAALTLEGFVVQEIDVEVPGGADAVVYNPLGAAPVFEHDVVYVNDATQDEADAATRVVLPHATSWRVYAGIDVVFDPAPTKVDMRSGDRLVVRTRLGLQPGGWETTAGWLLSEGRAADAARIACAAATIPPIIAYRVQAAVAYAEAADDLELAAATALRCAELADESDVAVARVCQGVDLARRPRDDVVREWRRNLEADPDSWVALYMLARLLPLDEARPLYERAIELAPDEVWPRRGFGMMLASTGEFAAAVPQLAAIVKEPGFGHVLGDLVAALVATGDSERVATLLRSTVTELGAGDLMVSLLARERARLLYPDAGIAGLDEILPSIDELSDITERERALLAAQAGDALTVQELGPSLDPTTRAVCEVTLLAARDLDAAVEGCRALPDEALASLPDEATLQLACEFDRLGDARRVDLLWDGVYVATKRLIPRATIDALPDLPGTETYLPHALRAALTRAAARRTDDEGEKQRLLALARKLDPLHAILSAGE